MPVRASRFLGLGVLTRTGPASHRPEQSLNRVGTACSSLISRIIFLDGKAAGVSTARPSKSPRLAKRSGPAMSTGFWSATKEKFGSACAVTAGCSIAAGGRRRTNVSTSSCLFDKVFGGLPRRGSCRRPAGAIRYGWPDVRPVESTSPALGRQFAVHDAHQRRPGDSEPSTSGPSALSLTRADKIRHPGRRRRLGSAMRTSRSMSARWLR